MFTTSAFRFALASAATICAVSVAEAKPRRVVVLDFDGQRTVADQSRSTVVSVLGEQYDVVATKRWEDARAKHGRNNHGPSSWSKAAREAGVDAIVEGWVDDEGSYKLLTVQVRVGKNGITEAAQDQVRDGLDELLEWVQPGVEAPQLPSASANDVRDRKVKKSDSRSRDAEIAYEEDFGDDDEEEIVRPGARSAKRGNTRGIGGRGTAEIEFEDTAPDQRDAPDDGLSARKSAKIDVAAVTPAATDRTAAENATLTNIFGANSVETNDVLGIVEHHVPVKTARFFIEGGAYYSSRTLTAESDDPQNYPGVGSKGIAVRAAVYPLPLKKYDGIASGIGFSARVFKSPASKVQAALADDPDSVGDFAFNYGGWEAAVHWRQPLGDMFAFDAEVGYGQEHYLFEADFGADVPDTNYGSFHAGGKLDLAITKGSTVGVSAAYHYVTSTGMLTDIDWYGPSNTSGLQLGADFVIPLPKQLYVRGEVAFRRYSSTFTAPDISAEGADSADDSTVNGSAFLGVAF